jgi:drug/metabolite transporter (DMT)-like permease
VLKTQKKRVRTPANYYSVLAIIACLLWSSAFVGIKIGLEYTTPLQFAGIRFMISGLMVLPFCGSILQLFSLVKSNFLTVLYITFFQTTLLYTLFYTGIELLPASVGALIIGCQPLIIAVMAHFLSKGDGMTPKKGVSIFLGFIGVILISLSRGKFALNSGTELLGIVLLLTSNICAGFGNILVSRTKTNIPYLSLNCIQLFLGGLFLFILSLPFEGFHWKITEVEYYVSLGWLSFVSAAALSIWFHLLRSEIQISELNIWKFLIPVSGACLSWLIIEGESPDLYSATGMVFIVLALLILNVNHRKIKLL